MIKVEFHAIDSIGYDKIIFVVIAARYRDKWILVRHKERSTWEVPGGHRELSENLPEAASRELFEETGAHGEKLVPVCIYSVIDGQKTSYGQLFYCEIKELRIISDFEIAEIHLFNTLPSNLTYPLIQPVLIQRIEKYLNLNYSC